MILISDTTIFNHEHVAFKSFFHYSLAFGSEADIQRQICTASFFARIACCSRWTVAGYCFIFHWQFIKLRNKLYFNFYFYKLLIHTYTMFTGWEFSSDKHVPEVSKNTKGSRPPKSNQGKKLPPHSTNQIARMPRILPAHLKPRHWRVT